MLGGSFIRQFDPEMEVKSHRVLTFSKPELPSNGFATRSAKASGAGGAEHDSKGIQKVAVRVVTRGKRNRKKRQFAWNVSYEKPAGFEGVLGDSVVTLECAQNFNAQGGSDLSL
ncbi:unnamed protein product [Toxocara canis]|uniref:C2 NT-type domain-containing protein n=1 Tax=Toxocara canis TaxID=6265 RepID=A0A183V164_TOXCA|nr:unnamed protein product [Toxocara canis]